jgi:hypothetical protein
VVRAGLQAVTCKGGEGRAGMSIISWRFVEWNWIVSSLTYGHCLGEQLDLERPHSGLDGGSSRHGGGGGLTKSRQLWQQ